MTLDDIINHDTRKDTRNTFFSLSLLRNSSCYHFRVVTPETHEINFWDIVVLRLNERTAMIRSCAYSGILLLFVITLILPVAIELLLW